MLDIFSSNPAFSVTSLTMALNRMPFQPGRIGELGLFSARRLSTISTTIEVKNNRLAFVPSAPRGSPPAQNVEDRRQLIPFLVPHFPLGDTLMADEIQGVRAFGTEDSLEAINTKVAEKLAKVRAREPLSPILIVVLRPDVVAQIADGYHRTCAAYLAHEDTQVPGRILFL